MGAKRDDIFPYTNDHDVRWMVIRVREPGRKALILTKKRWL